VPNITRHEAGASHCIAHGRLSHLETDPQKGLVPLPEATQRRVLGERQRQVAPANQRRTVDLGKTLLVEVLAAPLRREGPGERLLVNIVGRQGAADGEDLGAG
jgi:hypothetical protein